MIEKIRTENAPAPIGPYSQATRSNGFIFTAGQIGLAPNAGTITGDVAQQTELALENLRAILEQAGASLKNVVKTTIFLLDMNDFATVNEVYGKYFAESAPARSTVQVARLPKDARVEIEAIAATP